jgi:hypothetical protein
MRKEPWPNRGRLAGRKLGQVVWFGWVTLNRYCTYVLRCIVSVPPGTQYEWAMLHCCVLSPYLVATYYAMYIYLSCSIGPA